MLRLSRAEISRNGGFVTAGGNLEMRGILAKILGNEGERLAARFLRQQGFKILARQYHTKLGEIDLICRDGVTIVFVEVKTRRSEAAGRPEEAITFAKQKQLTRVGLAFLKEHQLLECPARFDVVSIVWPADSRDPQIDHYRHAFSAVGEGQMFS